MFTFVRCQKIRSIAGYVAAEAHARRTDNSKHVDRSRTHLNLVDGCVSDPFAIVEAFKARKKAAGASERKGSSVGLHLIVGVSPEWIAASGDVHDPKNPRNRALFDSAKNWAEGTFGKGSVIHTRLDVDEAGSGVVDVVLAPTIQFKQRGKLKVQISANGALEAAFGTGRNYRRMQDSWADYAKAHLDAALERGKPKEETQRDHVHHAVYRPAAQAAEKVVAEAEVRADRAVADAVATAADDWASAGWSGRRRLALSSAEADGREAGYAEGAAAMKKHAVKWTRREVGKVRAEAAEAVASAEAARDHALSVVETAYQERDEMARALSAETDRADGLERQVGVLRSLIRHVASLVPAAKAIIDRVLSGPPPAAQEATPPSGGLASGADRRRDRREM